MNLKIIAIRIILAGLVLSLFKTPVGAASLNLTGLQGVRNEISAKVLIEAYASMGYEISVEILPPERALQLSDRGAFDGEVHRIKGIEKRYTGLVMVKVPINYVESVVFSKNIEFKVNGWESLRPYSIVTRKGIKLFEDGTKGMKVDYAYSLEQAFNFLLLDRYEIYVESKIAGLNVIKDMGISGVKILEPSIDRTALYHYLHKKHSGLVPDIEKALLEMQKSGRIKRIRDDFILQLRN